MAKKEETAPAAAATEAKDLSMYPSEPGAVMKDKDGTELFVSSAHDHKAVKRALAAGWTMVDDRRPEGHPSHPQFRAAE